VIDRTAAWGSSTSEDQHRIDGLTEMADEWSRSKGLVHKGQGKLRPSCCLKKFDDDYGFLLSSEYLQLPYLLDSLTLLMLALIGTYLTVHGRY
jgi:hypothetical protein